ncbi:MAG: rod-binding protein [Longimicrobiales bacterium]
MNISNTDPASLLAALKEGRIEGADARLKTATDLLESSFYQELFKVMRETVPEGGMDGGAGQDIFASLLDQHVAEEAAGQSDRGIGAALYRHFSRLVGGAPSESGESAMPGESSAVEGK